jgi:hypothetical protein
MVNSELIGWGIQDSRFKIRDSGKNACHSGRDPGTQRSAIQNGCYAKRTWIPAFAGMTAKNNPV